MNNERLNQAINYETLLLASNYNNALVDKIYNDNKNDLVAPLLTNFSKFAEFLDINSENLCKFYFKVRDKFSMLPKKSNIICSDDDTWPKRIDEFPYCPKFLYYMGDIDLLDKKIVSIVGTKAPSDEDKTLVTKTVEALIKKGIVVSTGLSLGIGGQASAESVKHFAPTIAVIGTGLNQYYPTDHKKLQTFIATEGGLVITMVSPASPSQNFKFNFLLRNRLLSALSNAILIIDERDNGGAIKMTEVALENKRDVYFYSSLLKREDLKWPKEFNKIEGVHVVRYPGNLANKVIGYVPKKKDRSKTLKPSGTKDVQLSLF